MGKVKPKLAMWQLQQRQSLPLEMKEVYSTRRIQEWYEHWNGDVHVAFSGGKDSLVLLDLVRRTYPDVPAVFVDTGVEYPEIRKFVKTVENVNWIKPKKNFRQIIQDYGYPVISKEVAKKIHEIRTTKSEKLRRINLYGHEGTGWGKMPEKWRFLIDAPFLISPKCCDIFKKNPMKIYMKEKGSYGYVGTMASESRLRRNVYMRTGACNSFDKKIPSSNPLSIWTEEDIWDYIKKYNLPYCSLYDKGFERTGCMFCMFGIHFEKGENRFQRLERLYPRLHKYAIETLGIGEVLDFLKIPYKNTSCLF